MHVDEAIEFSETIVTLREATENAIRLHFNGDTSTPAATINVKRFCLYFIFAGNAI